MNKLIINLLIMLKNAYFLKKDTIYIFFNKKFILILKILYKYGLIQDFWLEKQKNNRLKIAIILKNLQKYSNFLTLKFVSKPSRSLFFSYKDLCKLYEKQTLYIFSTPRGYLTSFDCKKLKIGGTLFFYVK